MCCNRVAHAFDAVPSDSLKSLSYIPTPFPVDVKDTEGQQQQVPSKAVTFGLQRLLTCIFTGIQSMRRKRLYGLHHDARSVCSAVLSHYLLHLELHILW
jgi:hypothetical protein